VPSLREGIVSILHVGDLGHGSAVSEAIFEALGLGTSDSERGICPPRD
jgi:hypothetical protein